MFNDNPMPTQCEQSRPVQEEALRRFTQVFQEQVEKGKAKYGTLLMTHNGRKNDALQEACDLIVYMVQMMMEMEDKDARIAELEGQLRRALEASDQ